MATSHDFLIVARQEFDRAFDWYAARSSGSALGFASAMEAAIEKVLTDPERFGRTYADCRYCPLQRYPYSLVYHLKDQHIIFVALAHAKRRPGYWRTRLK